MKKIINWVKFILTGKYDNAVRANLVDLSGQGRDRYGK
jgi:hypothetical protein